MDSMQRPILMTRKELSQSYLADIARMNHSMYDLSASVWGYYQKDSATFKPKKISLMEK